MKNYFEIKDQDLINKLIIIIKIKKYEKDVPSIIFFSKVSNKTIKSGIRFYQKKI